MGTITDVDRDEIGASNCGEDGKGGWSVELEGPGKDVTATPAQVGVSTAGLQSGKNGITDHGCEGQDRLSVMVAATCAVHVKRRGVAAGRGSCHDKVNGSARAQRLYEKADAGRWKVPAEVLSNALERSAEKAFAGRTPSDAELDRYFDALHLADLALACACAMGRDDAWDHFVREFRPGMYRAADAIDPSRRRARNRGGALRRAVRPQGERRHPAIGVPLFPRPQQPATWLRSLIAQRYVDRHRETRRLEPLPEDSSPRRIRTRDHDRRIPIATVSSRRCTPCCRPPSPRWRRAIACASPATMRRR